MCWNKYRYDQEYDGHYDIITQKGKELHCIFDKKLFIWVCYEEDPITMVSPFEIKYIKSA